MTDKSGVRSWAEWFERRARYYQDPLAKIAYYVDGKLLPRKLMRSTLNDAWRKLRAGKRTSVLDVGGGVGLFARAFGPKLKKIVTTDISLTMARDGSRLNPGAGFFVCEASRLPFASFSFDRVLCYSVFHYFNSRPYAWKALDEFIRVTKPGGLVFIGDIPSTIKQDSCKRMSGRRAHYPASLKHGLKYMLFTPGLFVKFCASRGLGCEVLKQEIKGKPMVSSRFDIIIKVKK